MEEEIVREIMEECDWWEKILVKVLTKTYIKVYKIGIREGFMWSNKTVH